MPKNVLRICYESTTNFFIREFGTKILNSSKLLSRTPEYSRITRIVDERGAYQLRTPRITYDTTTNSCISGFLAIRGIRGRSVIGVLNVTTCPVIVSLVKPDTLVFLYLIYVFLDAFLTIIHYL